MPVLVDIVCSGCDKQQTDQWSDKIGMRHCKLGFFERLWTAPARDSAPSEANKCVVYVSDREGGQVMYPPRNDRPVPEFLRARGYERREIAPREMRAFERRHNVIHSASNYDSGSGREYGG